MQAEKGQQKSGQQMRGAGRGGEEAELFHRQDNNSFRKVFPVKLLPAAVTESLEFPFHRHPTLGADGKSGAAASAAEVAELRYRHRLTEGQLPPELRRKQQRIRSQAKAKAALLKRPDRRYGLAPGDFAEVLGA